MKRLFAAFVFMIWLCLPGASRAQNAAFFETLYDIPIMSGLTEVPDMALSFDSPEGHIAQAAAIGNGASPHAILSFYDHILPDFGWTVLGAGQYIRESETLEIRAEPLPNGVLIHLSLSPSP